MFISSIIVVTCRLLILLIKVLFPGSPVMVWSCKKDDFCFKARSLYMFKTRPFVRVAPIMMLQSQSMHSFMDFWTKGSVVGSPIVMIPILFPWYFPTTHNGSSVDLGETMKSVVLVSHNRWIRVLRVVVFPVLACPDSIISFIHVMLAAVILSLALGNYEKRRRNLYLLPSYWSRLLALPNRSRTATQKPTLVYAISAFGHIPPGIPFRMHNNHISTGIYRCSILDYDLKFCENFDQSRISVDKRFLMYVHYIPLRLTPDLGFCETVCNCKFTDFFLM